MNKYQAYYTGNKNGSIMVVADSQTDAETMVWDWLQDSESVENYPVPLAYDLHIKLIK
jgi:hypothetical protein